MRRAGGGDGVGGDLIYCFIGYRGYGENKGAVKQKRLSIHQ